jgi:hypothetical protein
MGWQHLRQLRERPSASLHASPPLASKQNGLRPGNIKDDLLGIPCDGETLAQRTQKSGQLPKPPTEKPSAHRPYLKCGSSHATANN